MNIAFCVDNIYSSYIRVAIKSIAIFNIKNNVIIHIISDFISDENKFLLENEIHDFPNIKLDFIQIFDKNLDGLKTSNHWPKHIWYRLFLPLILSMDISKVLYLDADILVQSDLNQLFKTNLTDKSIAGVLDIETFNQITFKRCGYDSNLKYICSGVMLMNLDYWRKNNLSEKVINWAIKNNDILQFPDQDAINYVCKDSKIILPLKFGILHKFFFCPVIKNKYTYQLKECLESPVIIHYAGCRPWYKDEGQHLMLKRWIKMNKHLKNPIKRKFKSSLINQIKIQIWRIFNHNIIYGGITEFNYKNKLFQNNFDF